MFVRAGGGGGGPLLSKGCFLVVVESSARRTRAIFPTGATRAIISSCTDNLDWSPNSPVNILM